MKKVLTALISTALLSLISSQVLAQVSAWATRCHNGACSSSNGGIEVQWQQTNEYDDCTGVLTGVKGLPIQIEDFERQEKTISQVMEKTNIIKKSTAQKASTPSEVPAGAGTETGKENVFSRRQSMSQSKTMGQGIKVDYTLQFVKWLGDYNPLLPDDIKNNPNHIGRYLLACDLIMQAYAKGKVQILIEKFILSRNASALHVKLVDKDKIKDLADAEKSLVLAKFVELAIFWHIPDREKRINTALVGSALCEIDEEAFQVMSDSYLERLEDIKKIKEPVSVLQLYATNKHHAFVKWLAESKPNIVPYITNPDERYIVFSSKSFETYPETKGIVPQLAAEFEKAIANRDESVTRVARSRFEPVKEKLADLPGNKKFLSPLFLIILVTGIIVFIKIKKKKERKGGETWSDVLERREENNTKEV